MSIEKVLKDFVSSREPGAIVLKGSWGVGKTYFWKNRIAADLLRKPSKKRYSYVSLFGVNSLPELKVALAAATDEFDRDAINQKRLGSKWAGWLWKSLKWAGDLLSLTPKVGTQLVKIYERVGFLIIKERTICFDDIERRGKGLELKDFLGLVSFLVEQRQCRVVAIVNSGQFSEEDQHTWDFQREKVFHGEVSYAPSFEDTIQLGLRNDTNAPWHDIVLSSLRILKVTNIRLVERTARFMRLVWTALEGKTVRSEVTARIAKGIPLLVWSAHGAAEDAPPLKYLTGQDRFDVLALGLSDKDERTPQERRWAEILSVYGYSVDGSLDHALVNMIETGVPDVDALSSAIETFEIQSERTQRKEAWQNSWQLYHNSISENGQEIVDAFEMNWPYVADHEHSTNLYSAVKMMRLLNRPDLATTFISLWVNARKGVRMEELSHREIHMFKRVDDAEILEAIDRARRESEEASYDLDEAFNTVRKDGHPSRKALITFSNTEISNLVSLLDRSNGTDFMRTLSRLVDLRDYPQGSKEKMVGEAFWEACSQVARRSPLNADRMRNWLGMEPPTINHGK